MKKNPVVHFEMPYKDEGRVTKFYSEVFGWNMNAMGEDMGKYILAGTTPADENMMATTPGQINGGFFHASEQAGNSPLVTIQVEELNAAIEAVKKAGGEVLNEPVDIPEVGKYVAIRDTEGSRVSLLQPFKRT
jgi:predicted enzyme related to lactoylglutathione lyase